MIRPIPASSLIRLFRSFAVQPLSHGVSTCLHMQVINTSLMLIYSNPFSKSLSKAHRCMTVPEAHLSTFQFSMSFKSSGEPVDQV
jgi:hypothetical protein